MNKKTLAIIVAIVVVVLAAVIIIKKKHAIANLEPPAVSAVSVKTAKARDGSLESQIETIALVKAETSATVSAQVSGNVIKMLFNEGDTVKKGQSMAFIDPSLYDDALESAKSKAEAALRDFLKQEAIFNRDKALYDNGAISKQNLEVSEAQFESAKAARISAEKALESARTMRNFCDVKAPYSGVVTGRLVEPGDLATPGKALYTIEIPGKVKLISKLSQDTLARLTPGGRVAFSLNGRTFEAKTTRIYPSLDNLHLGTVETELSEPPFGLPSGATVKAIYSASLQSGIVVPSLAVLRTSEGAMVLKVKDGKSFPVKVEIISEGKNETAVKGDIMADDDVIVGMPSELVSLSAGSDVTAEGSGK